MSERYFNINEVVDSISKTHRFDKSELIFLNTSDVEAGKIISANYFPISGLKGQAKKTIQNDDILFSEIRPKNKRYAYVNVDNPENYVVSTKLMVLRNKNKLVDNKYFYYFLTSDHMLSILQDRAENRICSFPQITFDLLSEYKIRVPSLLSQQRIASVLSALDDKIELNNRINAELEAMAKTLYDYWFVQFDFPDANGKPYKSSGGKMVYNEKLKRDIPEGWEVKELNEVVTINNDSINPEDGKDYVYFSIPVFDVKGTFEITQGSQINSNKFIAKETDILVSKLNPWFNRVIYALKLDNQICSTEFVVWTPKNKNLKSYFYFFAKSSSFITYCTQSAAGTSNSHKRVNPIVMLQHLLVFNEAIANAFSNITSSIINKYQANIQENQQLTSLRDWLLPMLMNGQVGFNEDKKKDTPIDSLAQ